MKKYRVISLLKRDEGCVCYVARKEERQPTSKLAQPFNITKLAHLGPLSRAIILKCSETLDDLKRQLALATFGVLEVPFPS